MEQATAPLVSSDHYCVAIETRGWRCMLCFFLFPEADKQGNVGRKHESKEGRLRQIYVYVRHQLRSQQEDTNNLLSNVTFVELRFISGFHPSADKNNICIHLWATRMLL